MVVMEFYLYLVALVILFYFVYEKFRVQENQIIASPSSSHLSLSGNWEHDVFPSFHGPDVRNSFLGHILKEFNRKGINSFIDTNITRGDFISPALKQAIKGSKISIVLLSKNYASSSWCLEELVEIMKNVPDQTNEVPDQTKNVPEQTVLTVFYDVEPADVRKQTGHFGKVFEKTCQGKTKEKIDTWRKALEGVGTIAGYHNWIDEASIIESIADEISKILNHSTRSRDFDNVVGIEAHMENLAPLLDLHLGDVRMIGILGTPGIGKTTIARSLFHQHSREFQQCVFMEDIRARYIPLLLPASSDDYRAKLDLQQQFLAPLTNQRDITIGHLRVAQERLQHKKVLAILDNVDRLVQLEAIANEAQRFGPGSRIVVTTRDLRVLKAHGINHIYKVDFPSSDEALEIFCLNAFRQKFPKDGFVKLAHEVTCRASKLPLGLKVLGSYFRGMTKEEWTNELPRIESRLDGDIESTLRFSYDALFEEDKDLFLHIACFFNNEVIEEVKACLGNSFSNVTRGFQVLMEKSLISYEYGKVKMHDLLVRLGKEIIRKPFVRKPGKRRFLFDCEEIGEVLTGSSTGSKNVIGIDFEKNNITNELNISERAFDKMSSLQFLRFRGYMAIPDKSPKLRFLKCIECTFTCLSFIANTEFLVKLSITYSDLEKLWEGIIPLQNLKWMDLSMSRKLKELPNFSSAINLLKLDLHRCRSLMGLPSSIGNATNLEDLDLTECSSLKEIPSSIGNLHKLVKLNLEGCSRLEVLPLNVNLKSLIRLGLTGCSMLKRFPEISTNIKRLYLVGTLVKEFPPSTRLWSRLERLKMSYSENLKESPSCLEFITELHVGNKEIKELGTWVKDCSRLECLELSGCKELVYLPELPSSLTELNAENCESLERLDCSFGNPNIRLNFGNCFKLNKEARDLIIQTSTDKLRTLPGREIPTYFTYRGSGGSIAVKLNERSFPSPVRFKACVLLVMNDYNYDLWVVIDSVIVDKQKNIDVMCFGSTIYKTFKEHLYIFEFEAGRHVTSTELLFEPRIRRGNEKWEIKECGIMELV